VPAVYRTIVLFVKKKIKASIRPTGRHEIPPLEQWRHYNPNRLGQVTGTARDFLFPSFPALRPGVYRFAKVYAATKTGHKSRVREKVTAGRAV
jgi:hypothetical protein